MSGLVYFAIGDVHGEADKLQALHDAILDRIAFENCAARIIHLGDYVDRGPDSRGVVERVMQLEAAFADSDTVKVISLMGNHEQMMLDAYDADPDASDLSWWTQGGAETAASYDVNASDSRHTWRAAIPREHINWMRRLPLIHHAEDDGFVFVHAGIEPASFPNESERIYLWTRSERFMNDDNWPRRAELDGLTVIHGHTPTSFEPEVKFRRINVDTGACFGGPLTAAILKPNEQPSFIRAS